MYDIFYVSTNDLDQNLWKTIKEKYPNAQKIENCKGFDELSKKSFTKMFWVIWDDMLLENSFNLNSYRATKWDDDYVHVFKNGEFFDGICLFPKNKKISQREFDNRFFVDKKEIDIVASTPKKYCQYEIDTYSEYQKLLESSKTNMFWVIWKDTIIDKNFKFNYQVPKHNQNIVHIFKNGEFFDGICLFPKNKKISQREFDNRFFIDKKEIDIVASVPVIIQYDVIFISYNEPNADKNYDNLLKKFPNARRVHGVKGIHQAHIAAANLATTDLFYVVDGDAELVTEFNFKNYIPKIFREHVHVWRSQNPINNLVYGYGGVKLLPREKTIKMDLSKPDMTTSISSNFKSLNEISNITAFNTDPFNTWKSAFRECVKLSSKIIDRQNDIETDARLKIWCTTGKDKLYGNFAIDGAVAGAEYGKVNRENLEALKKINDFDWLKEQYEQRAKNIHS